MFLAAVDEKRVGRPLCINRREDSTEFVVGFAGGWCLNSDCHILEARLGHLRIDLLKPLGRV